MLFRSQLTIDYLQAVIVYRQLVQLTPTDADAHYNLGVALKQRRSDTESIASLESALQLYQQQGNTEGAKKAEDLLDDLN